MRDPIADKYFKREKKPKLGESYTPRIPLQLLSIFKSNKNLDYIKKHKLADQKPSWRDTYVANETSRQQQVTPTRERYNKRRAIVKNLKATGLPFVTHTYCGNRYLIGYYTEQKHVYTQLDKATYAEAIQCLKGRVPDLNHPSIIDLTCDTHSEQYDALLSS